MTAKECKRAQTLFALLGSPNEGEREAARKKLEALLKKLGKTWNDLPELLQPEQRAPPAVDPRDTGKASTFDYPPVSLVYGLLERYVAMTERQYVAVALWVIHTHVFDRFMITPRLVLTSPVRGCGKSTLFDVVQQLVNKPDKCDNATAATIRHDASAKSTLLLDEADNLDMEAMSAMRAVLNAGHRRDGKISRMVDGASKKFDVFAPVALAAIGVLSLPLMHRSIVIHMQRHDGSGVLERLDTTDTDQTKKFDAVYSYLRRWTREIVLNRDPEMPAEMRNRVADNWRPLISIADACGPEWGARARETAVTLSRHHQEEEDIAVILLRDIRKVFEARDAERLLSRMIVDDLVAMVDEEWSEWRGPRGEERPHKLTTVALASLLRPFGIKPRTIWPLHRTASTKSGKGYLREQFENAWRSYCDQAGTPSQPGKIKRLGAY